MSPARRPWGACALAVALCLILPLAGCGGGSYRSGGVRGTKPYTVRGRTYYPLKSAHGFVEVGTASWYGPGFHGKKTANGETYNQHALTAAHKLLPLGSTVKVTHLGNGRSVTVRVNDRGPFVDDRVIDLSRKAAERIDMLGTGTVRVRVQSLSGAPGQGTAGVEAEEFYIQLGSFRSLANAQALVDRLAREGQGARLVPKQELWHVQAGPWPNMAAAQRALPRFDAFPGAFVMSR